MKGFSLIELVIVIVVLGILAAIAIPRYVDLQSEAQTAAASGNEAAAKSAFAILIAQNKRFPTGTELIGNLNPQPTYNAGNLEFDIDGTTYYLPIYTGNCDTATPTLAAAVGNTIQCVGAISTTAAT